MSSPASRALLVSAGAMLACIGLHVLLFLIAPSAEAFPGIVALGFLLGAVGAAGWTFGGGLAGGVSLAIGLLHVLYFAGHSQQARGAAAGDGIAAILLGHAIAIYLRRRSQREATDRALRLLDVEERLNASAEKLRRKQDYSAALVARLAKFPELRHSCEQLGRCLKLGELADTLVFEAVRLSEAAQSAALYLYNAEAGQIMLSARHTRYEGLAPPSVSGDAHDRYVFTSQKPFLSGSTVGGADGPKGKGREASFVIVPLLQTGRTADGVKASAVGVLRVSSNREDAFSREELELLNIVGDLAAMALSNVTLYERTQAMAITDGLTGLLTQYEFLARLSEELARADRDKRAVSLLMIDVDHFKPYNDAYGHQAGDQVLRRLGEVMREMQRPGDLLARYGGEEFTALLMTDLDGGAEAGEQLRKQIEAQAFRVGETETKVTISVGIASYPAHAKERDGLIRAADKAMYASKAAGRNRLTKAKAE